MSHPVTILGIGAEGLESLSGRARQAIASATFLAGGKRHLRLIGPTAAETFPITNNIRELAERLRRRSPEERCVVIASGDPLFYGIGKALGEALGRDQIVVEPAVSSLALAFARFAIPWHDAAIASIHGRALAETVIPLLGRPTIGLFTQDGSSPSAVAELLLDRGLHDYTAFVCEALGTVDERCTRVPIADLVGRRFADLNVLILTRDVRPPLGSGLPCPPDDLFARPDSRPVLLTHRDVRAAVLSRFWGLLDGPIWDIGAGLGGLSIGLARTFPGREVVAVERTPAEAFCLHENRRRFGVYNLRIVEGVAPECLENEPSPAGVFLGGSGGRLDAILDLAFDRLRPGGIFVADFVGLENLERARARLRDLAWELELTQLQVHHGERLANLTVLTPLRPVWILRSNRPVESSNP